MPAVEPKALIKRLELSRTAQMVNTPLFYRGGSGIFFTSTYTLSFPMGIACFVQIIILKLLSDVITQWIRGSKRWSDNPWGTKHLEFEGSCHLWSVCLAQGSLLLCIFLKIPVQTFRGGGCWGNLHEEESSESHKYWGSTSMKQSLWLSLDLVQKYGVKSKPEFIAGVKLFITESNVPAERNSFNQILLRFEKHSII